MAAKPTKSSGQKDNFTRNLVIGMVALVVAVGVIFSVTGNQTKVSSKVPTTSSKSDGYGLVFNASARVISSMNNIVVKFLGLPVSGIYCCRF